MRDWEEIKTRWDGSSNEELRIDHGLMQVRPGAGGRGRGGGLEKTCFSSKAASGCLRQEGCL
jgi:hypothetical protein